MNYDIKFSDALRALDRSDTTSAMLADMLDEHLHSGMTTIDLSNTITGHISHIVNDDHVFQIVQRTGQSLTTLKLHGCYLLTDKSFKAVLNTCPRLTLSTWAALSIDYRPVDY